MECFAKLMIEDYLHLLNVLDNNEMLVQTRSSCRPIESRRQSESNKVNLEGFSGWPTRGGVWFTSQLIM